MAKPWPNHSQVESVELLVLQTLFGADYLAIECYRTECLARELRYLANYIVEEFRISLSLFTVSFV